MRVHRCVVAFVGAVLVTVPVAVVGLAGPASAHSQLLATGPAADATVQEPAGEVTLTFNEPVKGSFSTVVVTGPDDLSYSRDAVRVVDSVVHQAVYPLRSGPYRVAWRVVSADGHPVSGEFRFTVALPAGAEPTEAPPSAAAASGPAGGSRLGWWGVPVVALMVVAVAVLVIRRRRRSNPR